MQNTYRDTREFVPVDVDKGIDRLTGEWVKADALAPEGYTLMPKCKFCKSYTETEPFIGQCEASMQEPKFIAYGDMNAVTCEMYNPK